MQAVDGSLRHRAKRVSCAFALATAVLLLLGATGASADTTLCTSGSGSGQCDEPNGVAVSNSTGDLYVADRQNNRIDVFASTGAFQFAFGWGVANGNAQLQTCTSTCLPGLAGGGAGQLDHPQYIAVDPAAPHNVYVFEQSRVQRFTSGGGFINAWGGGQFDSDDEPIAVGPDGNVYVGDSIQTGSTSGGAIYSARIRKFEPSGAFSKEFPLTGQGFVGSLAIDSVGDFYVMRGGGGVEKIEKIASVGTPIYSQALDSPRGIGVDAADHLFVSHFDGAFRVISELDSSGNPLRRFGYESVEGNLTSIEGNLTSIAPDVVSGGVYGAESTKDRVRLFFPPPSGPIACCLTATPGNTKATVTGGINPEGKSTTYHFEYVTEAHFAVNGFNEAISTPESTSIGSDFNLHITPSGKEDPPPVSAQIGCTVPPHPSCLKPETEYRYRLVATNSDGITTREGTFETLAPFEIKETWATDVGIEEARVYASVNPLGIPASAQFEYVDDASFQASGFASASKAPSSPIALGSSETAVRAAVQLFSLAPDTTYRYRVAVSDPFAEGTGPVHTFRTYRAPAAPKTDCPNQQFRIAASAPLPDCRAYEMVSPVDKNGNDIEVLVSGQGYPARLDQSSEDGDRFAYSSSTAFGDAQSAPWSSEYMARRTEGEGWSTHSLNPPREVPSLATLIVKFDVQYKAFSADLNEGWLVHDANPMLDECAPEGFINLYRRNNTTEEYEALVINPPTNIDKEPDYRLELQGLSADGSHAVFLANAKLTDDASGAVGRYQVYEHIADPEGGCGRLRLVSFLPNGKPASNAYAPVGNPAQPGEHRASTVVRGVSADGRRVFFTLGSGGVTALYARVNADQEQSAVSKGECTEPDKGCTLEITTEPTQFWTAPTDGSRVVYSVGTLGDAELFEFDVDKALAGEPAKTLISGKVRGVVGASEDASRIYFVSYEAIDGEGKDGQPNLYLYEPEQNGSDRYRLVATLSNRDGLGHDLYGLALASARPIRNGVRLSTDGSHLAFVSQASLTGYDNLDATTGEPAIEVYLYDTADDAVHCISCNPSGGRPHGQRFEEGGVVNRVSAMMAPGESQTFNPRALSTDGNRLFFESFEALLPRDTNGKADVYEWMRASGEEACEEAGAELYVPSAAGCLSLISSGQSPVDTEFADASPDGSDVFIRTQSSLLPQDIGLVDVYDARMGGGLPQPPAPPAACEGEACQGPLEAPDDPTPASSAFEGAGNVDEATAKKKKAKKQKKHAKKHHKKKKKSKARHNRKAGR